ncbi:AsmA family protein [Thiomicrorhabdus sp. ZW0627]|uniref:AsmA family protein n=1 Tax=Thiomicrorhabdus sp. ZW0627 TaxID=3039774 RepID=UPI00243634D2|nr:AsmA family protein [Thiomicrorhabdus sp. ZW0627]MDG6773240.1 AsmA family protein [Thiomicrorhabdus sp. ZW0627]
MSLLKKILIGFVSLIVLFIAAIAIIVATVDPNEHREEITQFVSEQTGRDLTIGDMNLSFFPRLGLSLQNAQMSNAEGFGDKPFASVKEVNIGVAILPLLKSKLEIDTLTLHGLTLDLQRNADGVTNWDDLVAKGGGKETKDRDIKDEGGMEKLASLSFGGLDIRDSYIRWDDKLNQQTVELTPFELTSDSISFGQFFNLNLKANTKVTNPDLTTETTLSAEVKIDQDGQLEIKNLKQNNELQGKDFPVQSVITELELPSLKLAMEQQQIDLPSLMLSYSVKGGQDFPAKKLEGKLQISDVKTDVKQKVFGAGTVKLTYDMEGATDFALKTAKGDLSLNNPEFSMEKQILKSGPLALQGDLTGDSLPNGKAHVSLSTQPALNLTAQTAALNNISLKALDLSAKGQVNVTQLKDQPKVASKLSVGETNLRKLFKQLGLQIAAIDNMSDKTSLTKASADLAVDFDSKTQAVNAKNILVKLDDSQLKGSATFKNFEKPNIGFNLGLDKINLNRYLPPKPEKPEAESKAPSEDFEVTLPMEMLRNLTINGTVKAGDVTYDKLNPKNIVATVKGQNGLININPLKMDIFKTSLLASGSLDVRGQQPKYAFKTNAKNVPVGDVLLALTDNDRLSGTGAVNADITTGGTKLSQFKQNLNGTASVDLKDGAVKGFNLAQSIRQAKAKIAGQQAAGSQEELKTDFSSLIGEVAITNGVVDTKKLLAQAPYMRINGSGKVNLVKEDMDYLVKTKIVASDKGQGGEDLKDLNGLTIPIKLKGALTGPKVSLDLGSLLEQKAKQEVEQKVEEKKEEVKKQLEDQLKENLLKGFKF